MGIAGHELGHAFTEQHAKLIYTKESGGLDEALRYLDTPTKKCYGKKPGDDCPIDNAKDYDDKMDVHFSSGIFSKVFYLIATSPNWNTQKAFDVMLEANKFYWTERTSFRDAACGVINTTNDYHYDVATVISAMREVGIDTTNC